MKDIIVSETKNVILEEEKEMRINFGNLDV